MGRTADVCAFDAFAREFTYRGMMAELGPMSERPSLRLLRPVVLPLHGLITCLLLAIIDIYLPSTECLNGPSHDE